MSQSNGSEFAVEVVKVYAIEEHPNAQRLDIVRVGSASNQWSYTLIDAKGSRKVGDLVVFVSVDAIVPLTEERWAFLRPDSDSSRFGAEFHRVRGIKLRGIRVQGILTGLPSAEFKLGDNLAELMHIEKYESPQDREGIRTESGKKALTRWQRFLRRFDTTRRLTAGVPDYEIYSLRKFDPFTPGELVELTEKLHGTNVRFGLVGNKTKWWQFWRKNRVVVGSHHTWKGRGTGGYYNEDLYTQTVRRLINMDELPLNVVFYGEIFGVTWTGAQIQDMTYGRTVPSIRLFLSCWDVEKKCWVFNQWHDVGTVVPNAGFPLQAWSEETLSLVKSEAEEDSHFEGIQEGIVVHSVVRPGMAAKWVSLRYQER